MNVTWKFTLSTGDTIFTQTREEGRWKARWYRTHTDPRVTTSSVVRAEVLPEVPADFPVRVLDDNDNPPGRTTCGTCNRSWDDDISTFRTPIPSGRCPFEYYHAEV